MLKLFASLRNACIYFAESVKKEKKICEKWQTCHWSKLSPSGTLLVHLWKCIYKRVKMLVLYVSEKMWEKQTCRHHGQWRRRGRKGRHVWFCFVSHCHNSVTINGKLANWFPQFESVFPWWQLVSDPSVLNSTHGIFTEFSPPHPLERGSDGAAWLATHHNNPTRGFKVPLIKDFFLNF